jgi:DNA-binding response OmpR family regulator
MGFDVRTAKSAEDGQQQIEQFRPDINFLDYQLPGRNGLEFLAHLDH